MRVTAALVLHFDGEGDGNAAVEKDHGAVSLPLWATIYLFLTSLLSNLEGGG